MNTRRDLLKLFGIGCTVVPIIGQEVVKEAQAALIEIPKVQLVTDPGFQFMHDMKMLGDPHDNRPSSRMTFVNATTTTQDCMRLRNLCANKTRVQITEFSAHYELGGGRFSCTVELGIIHANGRSNW